MARLAFRRVDQSVSRFRGLRVDRVLGFEVPVATSLCSRLLGLAYLDRDGAGMGLLIPHCRCVHTFGMRFDLDLCFFDAGGAVIAVRQALRPRRVAFCGGAAAVLEVPATQGGEFSALAS
ncbi:MAG: hypothetical protein QOF13_2490 [Solirubrobacterales bacterium]|nr:hypothetical protein [Solirubrobacterales bacterium]